MISTKHLLLNHLTHKIRGHYNTITILSQEQTITSQEQTVNLQDTSHHSTIHQVITHTLIRTHPTMDPTLLLTKTKKMYDSITPQHG